MLLLSLSWYKIIMIALALRSENIYTINTSLRYFYFLGMMLLLGKHQFIVSSIDDSGTSESAGSHSVVSSSPTTSLRKEISSKLKSRRGSSNLVRYFFDTFLFCFTRLLRLQLFNVSWLPLHHMPNCITTVQIIHTFNYLHIFPHFRQIFSFSYLPCTTIFSMHVDWNNSRVLYFRTQSSL